MKMCYDGALAMPSNCVVIDQEEMTYVEGGGTITLKVGANSFVMGALAKIGGFLTAGGITAALTAIGGMIATAITVGTAGLGLLYIGAFIIKWGGIAAVIAGFAVDYGINSLKGKTYEIASGWLCPNFTLTI